MTGERRLLCPHCGETIGDAMTAQQRAVYDLIVKGRTTEQIASALGISVNHVKVVKSHIRSQRVEVPGVTRGPLFSAAEIEKTRELIKSGVVQGKQIARALGRNYTGAIHTMMRRHCSDLLPPKREYAKRYASSERRSETYVDEMQRERKPWKPGDPKPEWLRRAG